MYNLDSHDLVVISSYTPLPNKKYTNYVILFHLFLYDDNYGIGIFHNYSGEGIVKDIKQKVLDC